MNNDDNRQQAEEERERFMFEDDLLDRIRCGLSTADDAKYVAWALGHTVPLQPKDYTTLPDHPF